MSKLRSDELVNMEGDGAPSFPRGATSIEPTADNQVATKLYVDTALSASFGNAVSNTAPTNPAIGSFWTDTSVNPSALKTWDGTTWIEFAGTAAAAVGVVVSLPSLSATNLEHAPATITASAAQVSNATLYVTKWYKDDVEIVGATGSTYVATEPGVYRYEERWADDAGNILTPSLNKTIELLSIEAPSITIPVAGTGLPDFDYTAESSAIANVGQVVNDVPTVGSDENFNGSTSFAESHSVYDPSTQRIVIAYTDWANNEYGTVVVGQVNGDSITFGTPAVFRSQKCINIRTGYDPVNEKVYVAFVAGGNGGYVSVMAGDVNPTTNSIDFGGTEFLGGRGGGILGMAYDTTNQNMVIAYQDDTNHRGVIECVTMRDAAINFLGRGPQTVFAGSINDNIANNGGISSNIVYDPNTNRIVIAYSDDSDYDGKVIVGEGTGGSWNDATVNFGSPVRFDNLGIYSGVTHGSSKRIRIVYNPDAQKIIIGYRFQYSFDNQASYTANAQVIAGTVDPNTNTVNFGNSTVFGDFDPRELEIGYDSNYQKMILAYHPYIGGNTNRLDFVTATIDGTTISVEDPVNIGSYSTTPYYTSIAYDSSNQKFVVSHNSTGGISNVVSPVSTATQLTLTDTTVSKVSDGSLVGGSTIDEVLTVGETVQADTAVSSTVATPVFNATVYKGNSSSGSSNQTQNVDTGINLDAGDGLIIFKQRTGSQPWRWHDTVRGIGYGIESHNTNSQSDYSDQISASSTGFTVGDTFPYNQISGVDPSNLEKHSAWNFRAAPGFLDIVTYTGNGTAITVPHSLGSAPGMMIIKSLDSSGDWGVYHKETGSGKALYLNQTRNAFGSSAFWAADPTDTEFSLGSSTSINGTYNYVAYLFADTPGLIKCGTYTGTGSYQTIDTGFKPKFVITKSRSHSSDWYVMDSETPGKALYTNADMPQQTVPIGYVNNGFTVNGANFALNTSGYEYIYMAIAEDAEVDITSDIYASGTVSASSGNTITLSNTSGTWSTGMKVQGVTTDTKDYPDPIDASAVTFASSQPVVTSGTVSAWDYAEWNLSYDSQFSSVVHEKAVPLTATGTQAGPDSFPIQAGTEYFVRTKYASFLPSGQSDWSAVTRFLTKANVYADDVFSTYLYEGNGGTQTITNGIDLEGEGGLVWVKNRSSAIYGGLWDTERGANKRLRPDTDIAEATAGNILTSFDSNGFSINTTGGTQVNNSGEDYVSWTFRKKPGFFDVVTYTGDGSTEQVISHNLGSVPGMIICKRTNKSGSWFVYHKDMGANSYLLLDQTSQKQDFTGGSWNPTASTFNAPFGVNSNFDGDEYVAYIFAHDDQSFGTNGDESIIKCGSFTTNSSGVIPDVNLGFEPQFLLIRNTNFANWYLYDSMRGLHVGSNETTYYPNLNNAEISGSNTVELTSTGFTGTGATDYLASGAETFIYMAIRRPHKPPTAGTDVFDIVTRTSANPNLFNIALPYADAVWNKITGSTGSWMISNRLTDRKWMRFNETQGEQTANAGFLEWDYNYKVNPYYWSSNQSEVNYILKRAPGFFDVVTYTGNGSARTIPHNLGTTPSVVIVKSRDAGYNWYWQHYALGANTLMQINSESQGTNGQVFNSTLPTSSVFSVGSLGAINTSNHKYIAYLFGDLDGISKAGVYTGTGSNINVDCGFTAGARFVIIKRVDGSPGFTGQGDWYVWDSVRGISGGNDPYLLLNETDSEVTSTDYIDPLNAGFTVTSSAPADINASGGTYLFLAIA